MDYVLVGINALVNMENEMTPSERIAERANGLVRKEQNPERGMDFKDAVKQAITEWLEELKKGVPEKIKVIQVKKGKLYLDGRAEEYDRLKAWLDREVWGVEENKEWCSHVVGRKNAVTGEFKFYYHYSNQQNAEIPVPDSWLFCPNSNCGAKRPESKLLGVKEVVEAYKKFENFPNDPTQDLTEELAKVLCFAFYSDNSKWDRVSEATRDAYRAEAQAAIAFLKGKI